MPEHALIKRVTRWRMLGAFAAVAIVAAAATLSGSVAQGRVDPSTGGRTVTVISPGTVAIATGGGTVTVAGLTNIVASFGLNSKRPAGFTGNGEAQGRINYNKHAQGAGRHVNVPVTLMSAELSANPSPNGTGGKAQIVGDCTATGAGPSGNSSVLVYVEDNSDTGGGDMFNISFCVGPATSNPPTGCGLAEGGTAIRTGNIQIRPQGGSGGSSNIPTAARAPLRLP